MLRAGCGEARLRPPGRALGSVSGDVCREKKRREQGQAGQTRESRCGAGRRRGNRGARRSGATSSGAGAARAAADLVGVRVCFFVAAMAWWFERALVFAPRGDLRGGSTSPGFETVGAVAATRLHLRSLRLLLARESQGESRVRGPRVVNLVGLEPLWTTIQLTRRRRSRVCITNNSTTECLRPPGRPRACTACPPR